MGAVLGGNNNPLGSLFGQQQQPKEGEQKQEQSQQQQGPRLPDFGSIFRPKN